MCPVSSSSIEIYHQIQFSVQEGPLQSPAADTLGILVYNGEPSDIL
jgi:hypothetical protein